MSVHTGFIPLLLCSILFAFLSHTNVISLILTAAVFFFAWCHVCIRQPSSRNHGIFKSPHIHAACFNTILYNATTPSSSSSSSVAYSLYCSFNLFIFFDFLCKKVTNCRKQFVTGYMRPALPLSCERAGKSLGWITKLVNTVCDRLS